VGVQKVAARGKGVVTWHGEKSINEGPLIATHHTRRNLMENDEETHRGGTLETRSGLLLFRSLHNGFEKALLFHPCFSV
jgi:hypothetical protein